MNPATPIPAFSLFGQTDVRVEPRFCHVERIGDRWKLHSGHVVEHSHPHLHQLTYWVSGSGHYIADDAQSAISAGTFCWIPAGVVHGFRVAPGSNAIVLSMSDDFAREQLGLLEGTYGVGPLRESAILRLEAGEQAWIRTLFDRMEHEYGLARPAQLECIGALARLALAEIQRPELGSGGRGTGGNDGGADSSLLTRFMALVETRLGERPHVDTLASELGTTPYLLNRACRNGLGLRASDVVRRRHMQEAKRLLMFTALGVSEIGQLLGYEDPAHFARSFRSMTGQSPRSWRAERISAEARARGAT